MRDNKFHPPSPYIPKSDRGISLFPSDESEKHLDTSTSKLINHAVSRYGYQATGYVLSRGRSNSPSLDNSNGK